VTLPDNLVGRLEGKSSLGRLGLLIHSTAGFVDPGWDGHLTLELANILKVPITLYMGMPIAQISFMELTTPVENAYGSGRLTSKYQGDTGPTPSKYYLNFDESGNLQGGAFGDALVDQSVSRRNGQRDRRDSGGTISGPAASE
jgi:dCTP deaminase